MSVVQLLSDLSKKDIRLWLEGENLRFSAPEGAFTPDIRDKIVSRKPEIIEFLKQAQTLGDKTIEPVSRDTDRRSCVFGGSWFVLRLLQPV